MSGPVEYSENFKRKVVYEIRAGIITKEEARRRYHIGGHSTVLKWIRKFDREELYVRTMKPDPDTSKEALLKRIKELERQLEDEKLRSEGLSLLIDIAENELDIDIRKKPDTKQSKH